MRVAALSDIHGHLPALEAVPAEVAGEGVDVIVVAGDVEFHCTEYDVQAAVEAIHVLDAPVEERLLEDLLEPPDADYVTAYFEGLRGA